MKKILAISGGVDSMVLLDIFCKKNHDDVVVAHFDHGTRPSSLEDAKFVERVAESYGVPFVTRRAELGSEASEETARYSRYEFFSSVAEGYDGAIYTAHHANDLIESMAINLIRGTGWRGLTPFGNTAIFRPFLSDELFMARADILRYAASNKIVFRQDPTNADEKYLRNRIRHGVNNLSVDQCNKIVKIYHDMNNLRAEIDATIAELLPEDGFFERAWFFDMPDKVALEILRAALARSGVSATRPQIRDFLKAIREYAPQKKFNLPGDRLVVIQKNRFKL